MATLISVLTNQFFLIFLAIALGLALGKIKIGNFSLGVSGGIFSGIVIGFIAQTWAKGVQEGELGYSSATSVLKTGVVSNLFFTFFLMLFLVSIGIGAVQSFVHHRILDLSAAHIKNHDLHCACLRSCYFWFYYGKLRLECKEKSGKNSTDLYAAFLAKKQPGKIRRSFRAVNLKY